MGYQELIKLIEYFCHFLKVEHEHLREANRELFITQMNDIISAVERGDTKGLESTANTAEASSGGEDQQITKNTSKTNNESIDSGIPASGESGNEVSYSTKVIRGKLFEERYSRNVIRGMLFEECWQYFLGFF